MMMMMMIVSIIANESTFLPNAPPCDKSVSYRTCAAAILFETTCQSNH